MNVVLFGGQSEWSTIDINGGWVGWWEEQIIVVSSTLLNSPVTAISWHEFGYDTKILNHLKDNFLGESDIYKIFAYLYRHHNQPQEHSAKTKYKHNFILESPHSLLHWSISVTHTEKIP